MKSYDEFDLLDDLDTLTPLPRIKNAPLLRPAQTYISRPTVLKRAGAEIPTDLAEEDDRLEFDFTYQASRNERAWLTDSLSYFYEQHWFDDVLHLVKGGKEASVYQCAGNQTTGVDFVAAKVYRPRRFRNLKNDHLYREGRDRLNDEGNVIQDGRMYRAMHRRTTYGHQLMHTSWIEHEYQTLQILHAAGADIPTPFTRGHNAILMTFIGDERIAAPTLNTVDLARSEAKSLFERVLYNVDLMLAHDRIHGDLSAYNILYWKGAITFIDFPQAISPRRNRNAYRIFMRDIQRICTYFANQGVVTNPHRIAAKLWTAHGHHLTPDIHPSLLDDQDEDDLAYWRQQEDPR
jgi:RIO kinase 1